MHARLLYVAAAVEATNGEAGDCRLRVEAPLAGSAQQERETWAPVLDVGEPMWLGRTGFEARSRCRDSPDIAIKGNFSTFCSRHCLLSAFVNAYLPELSHATACPA